MTLRCDEIIITIVFLHYLIMMDNYSITVGGSTVSLLVCFAHYERQCVLAGSGGFSGQIIFLTAVIKVPLYLFLHPFLFLKVCDFYDNKCEEILTRIIKDTLKFPIETVKL